MIRPKTVYMRADSLGDELIHNIYRALIDKYGEGEYGEIFILCSKLKGSDNPNYANKAQEKK